jgi:FkbM family methyltransferase
MTVLDVGLHVGAFSSFAGRLVGPGGAIHAFEPTKGSLELARRNLDANELKLKLLKLNNLAVYSYSGAVQFTTYSPAYSAWNTTSTQPKMSAEPVASLEVECVSIDDYCRENGVEYIDLLKIDVEGAEVEVLQGARQMISKNRIFAIVFEISMEPLAAVGSSAADVIRKFGEQGFEVHIIGKGGRLRALDAEKLESFPPFANYAATRSGNRAPLPISAQLDSHPGSSS